MEMVLAMDAGDVLELVKTSVPENMTFEELEEILWKLAGPALTRVVKKIETNTLIKIPQNQSDATFCKKITPEDRFIDWKKDAVQLHNQIRAFSPRPGAYCFIEEEGHLKRLGIKRTEKILAMSGKPGETLVFKKDLWIVACGSGALSLVEIQLEGKKSLSIQEFFRGLQKAPLIKS